MANIPSFSSRSLACHPSSTQPRPIASASFLKETLKRSPFLVLAKTTPDTLPHYNVESDFRYFFIGDFMATFSCLHSKFLRRAEARRRKTRDSVDGSDLGGMFPSSVHSRNPETTNKSFAAAEDRQGVDTGASGTFSKGRCASPEVVANAKSLFPTTHEHIFEKDAIVVSDHQYPSTLNVVERCVRPGVDTIVYTTKTAAQISGRTYVLVACAPYDDVELGLSKLKSGKLAPELADPADVPLRWFEGAFISFPLPMAIVDQYGKVCKLNDKIARWEEWERAVEECMDRVREIRMADGNKECWEFSRVGVSEEKEDGEDEYGVGCRVWIWRPVAERDLYAICFRPHHGAKAGEGLPSHIFGAM